METVLRGVPCGVKESQVVNCKWLSDVILLVPNQNVPWFAIVNSRVSLVMLRLPGYL